MCFLNKLTRVNRVRKKHHFFAIFITMTSKAREIDFTPAFFTLTQTNVKQNSLNKLKAVA